MSADLSNRDNLQEQLKTMNICRFCLCTKKLSSIFAKDAKVASLAPLPVQVMACASIEIFTNDGMPSSICQECRILFEHSYRFKQMCKRADTLLRQYPLTGQWPKPLERPKIPQSIMATSNVTSSTNNTSPNILNQKAFPTAISVNKNVTRKILNAAPAISPEPPMPMRFTFKTEPNQDEMQIDCLEKVDNNKELTMEEVQKIIANAGDDDFIIDDNYSPPKAAPKVLNRAPKRLLNKDANNDSEPQFSRPKVQYDQKGNVEIITAIVQPNQDKSIDPLKETETVATDNFPCPFCERSFPLLQLRDIHLTRHNRERNFQCPECDKSFFTKYDLQKHEPRHTGEKPFKCLICEKAFSRLTLLHRHEKIHTDVPKFLCMYCEKPFISKDELETHIARHEKNRPFKCKECGKSFAFKQGLERHEVVHSAVLPYPCQYCNESFTTPSKLSRHLNAHAGDRPFPCKYCNKSYLLSHHLTRHLRSHKEVKSAHVCSECQKVFKTREELIYHTAVHSTTNMICTLCQMQFESVAEVSPHIKLHIDGDSYACEFCDLQFLSADDLLTHYDEKHTNEVEKYKYSNDNTEAIGSTTKSKQSKATVLNEVDGDDGGFEVNTKRETITILDGDDENVMATINDILNTEDLEGEDNVDNGDRGDYEVKQKITAEKPKILNQIVFSSGNNLKSLIPTQQNVRNTNDRQSVGEAPNAKTRKVLIDGKLHVLEGDDDDDQANSNSSTLKRKIPEKPIEIKVEKDDTTTTVSKVVIPKGITVRKPINNKNENDTSEQNSVLTKTKEQSKKMSVTEAQAVLAEKRANETTKMKTSPQTRTMTTRRSGGGSGGGGGNTLEKKTEMPSTSTSKQPQKVKQIRMTKAMADELTKQGRIKFKDGNMILMKPGKG